MKYIGLADNRYRFIQTTITSNMTVTYVQSNINACFLTILTVKR